MVSVTISTHFKSQLIISNTQNNYVTFFSFRETQALYQPDKNKMVKLQ